jgi:iron-sulfur cluster assembly protein/iron-sulfur cluster insertion protein
VITVTDNAAAKVKSLMEAEGDAGLALRVAVRPGGCSGYSYEMFFDSDIAADDIATDYEGVKVVVDPASADLLQGATLDFKDGLQGAGFAIENPNAQRSCGCGKSFS